MPEENHDLSVPIWQRSNLNLKEACAYSGVGQRTLLEMAAEPDASFAFLIGKKRMFNRKLLDQYIEERICKQRKG